MSLGLELLESQFSRAAVLTPTHGLSVGSWRRLATLLNRLSLQFCNSVGGLCCLISPRGGGWGDKVRLRRSSQAGLPGPRMREWRQLVTVGCPPLGICGRFGTPIAPV